MKTNRIIRLLLPCALGILLAACGQEDIGSSTGTLPEGMYPVEIFAVQEAETGGIQTRVTDPPGSDNQSQWSDGDKIFVKMDNGSTGVYKYNGGKFIAEGKGLYWPDMKLHKFTGWYYPDNQDNADGKKEYNLDNSVYIMYGEGNGQYGNPLTMKFSHKLAKVRVTLQDFPTSGEFSVSVWGYKKFKVNGSELSGSNWELISMKKNTDGSFEANIVPGQYDNVKLQICKTENGQKTEATAKLSNNPTLTAGKIHPYVISLNPDTKWVKVLESVPSEGLTIDGDVIINDNPSWNRNNRTINVTNNAHVTIRGLNMGKDFSQSGNTAISIAESKHLTLKVEGIYNEFHIANGAGIEMQNGSSLTIIGDGKEKSKLTIKTNAGSEGQSNICIGSVSSHDTKGPTEVLLEKIIIKDVSLELHQGQVSGLFSAAAIGLSYGVRANQSCKGIEIDNANITVTNEGKGACIGIGAFNSSNLGDMSFNITDISINNSYIKATAEGGGACIGFGVKEKDRITGEIGNITISQTSLELTANPGAFLVGRGQMNTQVNPPTIEKMTVNGETVDLVTSPGGWQQQN